MRAWGKYPSEEAFEIEQRLLTAVSVLLSVELLAVNCEVCGGGPRPVCVVTGTNVQVERVPSGGGSSRPVCMPGLGCQEQ